MDHYRETTSPRVILVDRDVYLIDLFHLGEPRLIGSYLIVDERPALVEVGPANSLEHLLEGLRLLGLDPRALKCVFLTHIHLDHGGATGHLLERFPHLTVYVHTNGAPHLVDPSRLLRSAQRLFGDIDTRFGPAKPVDPGRIRVLGDGEEVRLGRRILVALDTPGHAGHHLVYWEPEQRWVFAGDVCGVHLPDGFCVNPPTPPPEFHLDLWLGSIGRIRTLSPRRLLYTHFGWTDTPEKYLDSLESGLRARAEMVRRELEAGTASERICELFRERFEGEMARLLGPVLLERYRRLGDARINTLGLIRYWQKHRGVGPQEGFPGEPSNG
jgi:glyoxylase-like metal-dependent hydrolase (beta-lactamase superfamily II)